MCFLLFTLAVVIDCNRYRGYCAKREFNDSIGPLSQHGDRNCCKVDNISARPITPGRLSGRIFKCLERSPPAWVFYVILNVIVSVINLVFIYCQPKETSNENTERKFSHHQSEYSRISRIISVCMAISLVHQGINVIKIAHCRSDYERVLEMFHTVMLAVEVLIQGKCYVVHHRQSIAILELL